MVKIIKKHGFVNRADLSDLYYSWSILWNNYMKLFINHKSDFFIYTVSLHKNLVRSNNIIPLNSSIVLISVQYSVCIPNNSFMLYLFRNRYPFYSCPLLVHRQPNVRDLLEFCRHAPHRRKKGPLLPCCHSPIRLTGSCSWLFRL